MFKLTFSAALLAILMASRSWMQTSPATVQAKSCEELEIGEETIIPGEDFLHEHNARLMTQQMLERDVPGNAYRGFHPKTIGCVS